MRTNRHSLTPEEAKRIRSSYGREYLPTECCTPLSGVSYFVFRICDNYGLESELEKGEEKGRKKGKKGSRSLQRDHLCTCQSVCILRPYGSLAATTLPTVGWFPCFRMRPSIAYQELTFLHQLRDILFIALCRLHLSPL